ncbi:hypothetical protein GAYE_SCF03G2277 [Galdieria yellowstonensis]|jgi:hypothetical protein|uniref:Repressor of RNA polymerase III transcription n=1 Tax=Galdieria yellowstonensis TaxID=3028027 RepID=A0AAV9IAJ4_9RHOD|nr:hypothetical protein GAYE_SCF03G2277 [Galdieria yellowstonensis]
MKFLDIECLSELQRKLNDLELTDYRVRCQLEAYSCKPAGFDKKLSKSLEQRLLEQLEASPRAFQASPVGSLEDQSARKTLINLICTLNAAHQDYDFSSLQLSRLKRVQDVHALQQHVDSLFERFYRQLGIEFRQFLWENIGQIIRPEECEIYSYIPDYESDPYSSCGALWSFCYFFYHKNMKKILLFACTLSTRLADDSESVNSMDEEDFGKESSGLEAPFAMFETVI